MNILVVEPFYTESHKSWLDGFVQHSSYTVTTLTLPGFHWKWRMHGAAITLAEEYKRRKLDPDLIICTDFLDVNVFLTRLRGTIWNVPIAMYFHENQITYPWSPGDADVKEGRDRHYGFINYASALSADHVFFNSSYHRTSFLTGLTRYLSEFPDYKNMETVSEIGGKSTVLPVGVDLQRLDVFIREEQALDSGPPIILWNHRWEFDKNPGLFFKSLFQLKSEGLAFRLIVLGREYPSRPAIFDQAYEKLKEEIIHWGYVDEFSEYARYLVKANILSVTSNQDFFGISVVEAIYCGCSPLLPRRLAYPEHVSEPECFYESDEEYYDKLKAMLLGGVQHSNIDLKKIKSYDWKRQIPAYDAAFSEVYSSFTKVKKG